LSPGTTRHIGVNINKNEGLLYSTVTLNHVNETRRRKKSRNMYVTVDQPRTFIITNVANLKTLEIRPSAVELYHFSRVPHLSHDVSIKLCIVHGTQFNGPVNTLLGEFRRVKNDNKAREAYGSLGITNDLFSDIRTYFSDWGSIEYPQ
jgi:hypothetical protein